MGRPDQLIVVRLTGSEDLDGTWMQVQGGKAPQYLVYGEETTTMVATGNVEWDGLDNCAEVYVPENRLAEWKAEHDDC